MNCHIKKNKVKLCKYIIRILYVIMNCNSSSDTKFILAIISHQQQHAVNIQNLISKLFNHTHTNQI